MPDESNPCLDDSNLADFQAGRLDSARAALAESHIRTCASCSARLHALARPADVPAELLALKQYTELRRLGGGNMGDVYLAKNKMMDRLEVLKLIQRKWLDRPDIVDRFLREIRAAAKLSHANVVTAYAVYEEAGSLILAMEYVPGESLGDVLKDVLERTRAPMKVREACGYAYHAALGLQHAHSKGLVHRDVKPDNLMLTRDAEGRPLVKVVDFGLAKAVNETGDAAHRTGTGVILGTPNYMAPEQTSDATRADIRADVYSLGCTLFHFLTGHVPFTGAGYLDVLIHHRTTPAPDISGLRADVPGELNAVVQRMMAKTPADRYQTPAEVAQELRAFASRSANPSVRPSSVQSIQLPPPKPPREDTWVSPATGMKFVRIPASTFLMGSPDSDKDAHQDEKPQHRVTFTRDFLLGVYPVTVGQFRKFAEATRFKGGDWQSPGFVQADDHPVVNVSWNDAMEFCKWLSNSDGHKYRLPTEAEWEYSCRGGRTSKYFFGDDPAQLPQYANFVSKHGGTTPVTQFPANPFGLHDMHGNVWEWCADYWDDKYKSSDVSNPTGPTFGSGRVRRGGGWYSSARGCRTAYRGWDPPEVRSRILGFRLCRDPSAQ